MSPRASQQSENRSDRSDDECHHPPTKPVPCTQPPRGGRHDQPSAS